MSADLKRFPQVVWVPLVAVVLVAGLALVVFNGSDAADDRSAGDEVTAVWHAIDAHPAQLCVRTSESFWASNPLPADVAREKCVKDTEKFYGKDGTLGVGEITVLGTRDEVVDVAIQVKAPEADKSADTQEFTYLVAMMREEGGQWLISGKLLNFDTLEEAKGMLAPDPEALKREV